MSMSLATKGEMAVSTERVLTPAMFHMFLQLEEQMAKSRKYGVVPGEMAVKLITCYELRLPLMVATNGLYVVNGRVELESRVLAAMFKQHPWYDYEIAEHTNEHCTVVVYGDKQNTRMVLGMVTWGDEDTVLAGLKNKPGPWTQYPSDMVFYKALARAYRRYAPDLTYGVAVNILEDMEGVPGRPATEQIKSGAVEAEYTVVEEPTGPNPYEVFQAISDTLGAEAVLLANDLKIPQTELEVQTINAQLMPQYLEALAAQAEGSDG